ncbi:two-component sensor kinase [Oceanobacillus picturae]|uniref:Two-component sensor kinase n=1 Tax=Oceanobacillus picturae TaxID=171693 RepID=A0A0U9HDM4_9BACI|nr:two-component sensor kinase [Oceanobacillus picturae]
MPDYPIKDGEIVKKLWGPGRESGCPIKQNPYHTICHHIWEDAILHVPSFENSIQDKNNYYRYDKMQDKFGYRMHIPFLQYRNIVNTY